MGRGKQIGILLLLSVSIMTSTGCGKLSKLLSKETEETEVKDDDGCVAVQLPEGSSVEKIFQFKSKEQIYVSGASGFGVSDGVINIGILEDGNSVAWDSDSEFLYIQGEAEDTSVIHYAKQLRNLPISYEEFKTQYLQK